jgi:DNA-binding NarL/FixJ family response regulator
MRGIARTGATGLTSVRRVVSGQELSPAAVRRLHSLFERRRRLEAECERAADQLALAAQKACDVDGVSRKRIASELGVGISTVQGWVVRGRHVAR